MTEKQKYLLKLFREVDEICREHNLRYVLAGGSLIGALRHEGFVPWDDDVDLYMPRPDWEKFIEICKTELPPDREIQCSEVDRNYTNSFPRYASTNTCAIHKSQIIGKDCGGEIIDILTLDPIPADDKEYEKYRTHMMIYSDLINISVGYSDRWEIPASMYLKYLLSYIIHLYRWIEFFQVYGHIIELCMIDAIFCEIFFFQIRKFECFIHLCIIVFDGQLNIITTFFILFPRKSHSVYTSFKHVSIQRPTLCPFSIEVCGCCRIVCVFALSVFVFPTFEVVRDSLAPSWHFLLKVWSKYAIYSHPYHLGLNIDTE